MSPIKSTLKDGGPYKHRKMLLSNELYLVFILPVYMVIFLLIDQVSNAYAVQLTASLVPTTIEVKLIGVLSGF